jgi:transposase
MVTHNSCVGIDVCKDWLDIFCLWNGAVYRLPNTVEGQAELIDRLGKDFNICIGFEATGGHEWALWQCLSEAGFDARQLPPAQPLGDCLQSPAGQRIKFFTASCGTRAKTDKIDAEMIARFLAFRPEAGRCIPPEKLRNLKALTTKRAQLVEVRKRHLCQMKARRRTAVLPDMQALDHDLLVLLSNLTHIHI